MSRSKIPVILALLLGLAALIAHDRGLFLTREEDWSRVESNQGAYFIPGEDSYFSGWLTSRHPDGSIARRTRIKNGIPDGTDTGYYPDGTVQWVCECQQGVPVGRMMEFDTAGQLNAFTPYENGVAGPRQVVTGEAPAGPAAPPPVDGSPTLRKNHYYIGESDHPYSGTIEEHHDNGQLKFRATVKNGRKIESEEFFPTGQKRNRQVYEANGITVKASWVWNEDGSYRLYNGPKEWAPSKEEFNKKP